MGSIFAGYNGFRDDWFIEYRVCELVGAGFKPALVPNSPDVDLCDINCIPQDGIQPCNHRLEVSV